MAHKSWVLGLSNKVLFFSVLALLFQNLGKSWKLVYRDELLCIICLITYQPFKRPYCSSRDKSEVKSKAATQNHPFVENWNVVRRKIRIKTVCWKFWFIFLRQRFDFAALNGQSEQIRIKSNNLLQMAIQFTPLPSLLQQQTKLWGSPNVPSA